MRGRPGAASEALASYERYKRSYLGTAAQCKENGIGFVPLVFDADGGFGPSALAVVSKLADDAARLKIGRVLRALCRHYVAAAQQPERSPLVSAHGHPRRSIVG